MKKKTVLLLSLAAALLAGCQRTPETPVVIQKDQERMLAAAQTGSESSSGLSGLETPERFTGDWSGVDGCVIVHADARITLPDAAAVPTARIERKPFSQADADKMLSFFLKGNTLYQERGITKQWAQERLEHYRAIERGELPWEHDGTIDRLPDLIAQCEELVRTSPDESELPPVAPTAFQPLDDWQEGIRGFAQVDGKIIHVTVTNTSGWWDQAHFYVDGYGDMNSCSRYYIDELPESLAVDMTEEAALAMGNTAMETLGNGRFVCDQIRAVAYDMLRENGERDTGYEMEFVRTLNGFPIAHCPVYEITPEGRARMTDAVTGTSSPEQEPHVGSWAYERVTIHVNKDGIVYFLWLDPYTEPELQTADTQLMRFSDIADIFARMILVKNSDRKIINEINGFEIIEDIDIDNVRLSLMRIRSKDNFNEGLLVPVWDFWGTRYGELQDEAYRAAVYDGKRYSIQLTVNAIDGTVIDRDLGY